MVTEVNEPAFPIADATNVHHTGMTLRDYFAGKALAGQGAWIPPMHDSEGVHEAKARFAYDVADAMMEARKK